MKAMIILFLDFWEYKDERGFKEAVVTSMVLVGSVEDSITMPFR